MSRIRLAIKSDLKQVSLFEQTLVRICEALGLEEDHVNRVLLSVVEAVTNVIRHSYLLSPDHMVMVSISLDGNRLDLEVADSGLAMPAVHVERLKSGSHILDFDAADLDRIPEGGMGLEIIRRSMDEVDYTSERGTNRIRMTSFIGQPF